MTNQAEIVKRYYTEKKFIKFTELLLKLKKIYVWT